MAAINEPIHELVRPRMVLSKPVAAPAVKKKVQGVSSVLVKLKPRAVRTK